MDILMIKAPVDVKSTTTKPQWLIMVDEKTETKWSNFYDHKNEIVEQICAWLYKWQHAGMAVKL
eukprot:10995420-Ditylum_brightwellii.AAC.1